MVHASCVHPSSTSLLPDSFHTCYDSMLHDNNTTDLICISEWRQDTRTVVKYETLSSLVVDFTTTTTTTKTKTMTRTMTVGTVACHTRR